jgi:hypothetical protein
MGEFRGRVILDSRYQSMPKENRCCSCSSDVLKRHYCLVPILLTGIDLSIGETL